MTTEEEIGNSSKIVAAGRVAGPTGAVGGPGNMHLFSSTKWLISRDPTGRA
jgi:hypothetical protein